MSESNRLGISISATDAGAAASLRTVDAQIKGFQETLAQVTAKAREWGTETSAQSQKVAAALTAEIAKLQQQRQSYVALTTSVKETTAALKEEGDASAVIHRNLSQAISAAYGADRAINSAAESAKVLTTSLSAMAATEPAFAEFNATLAEQLRLQQALIEANYINRDLVLSQAKAQAEAGYMNRNVDLASGHTRSVAGYENRDRDMAAAAARAEANYQNQNLQLIQQKERAEAEYINAGMTAQEAKGRAEAEYHQKNLQLIEAQQRAEAEYINRNEALAYAHMRREADILNQAMGPTSRPFHREDSSRGVSNTTKEMRHLVAAFDEISRGQRGALFGTIGAAARDAGIKRSRSWGVDGRTRCCYGQCGHSPWSGEDGRMGNKDTRSCICRRHECRSLFFAPRGLFSYGN